MNRKFTKILALLAMLLLIGGIAYLQYVGAAAIQAEQKENHAVDIER